MSQQDVKGDVSGHVVGGDFSVNHHHYSSEPSTEPMLPAQKQHIHHLIDELEAISGKDKPVLWQMIHARVDVKTINQITTKKYHIAAAFLDEKIAEARAIKDRKQLLSRLLRLTEHKSAERDSFCLRNFGTTTLTSLNGEQLITVYQHFDNDCSVSLPSQINWSLLLKDHPVYVFTIFFIGVVFGMILK